MRKKSWILLPALAGTVLLAGIFAGCGSDLPFDPEEVYQEYDQARQELQALEAHWTEEGGTLTAEDLPELLDQAEALAEQYRQEGTVTSYEVTDTGVYLELAGGVGYLYTPPVEGLLSGDEAGQILTVEPYASNAEMLAHYILGGRSPDKEADRVAEALPDSYTFPEENNWDAFSIEQVENLKDHAIILWYGHGGYTEKTGSLLGTSVPADDPDALRTYSQELASGELVLGNDAFLLSPLYFDKHLEEGALEGSLIYLGACSSAADQRLATVFLDKGASLVVGNTRDIFIRYNLYMMCDFVQALTNQYEDGTYWTAEDALAYAKEENGEADGEFFFLGAKVQLIYPLGESGYRLVEAPEEDSGETEAALRYWQEVLKPQYGEVKDTFTLNYQCIENQGAVSYYQSDAREVALLGGAIRDLNGDGIGDLIAVSLERHGPTGEEDIQRLLGQDATWGTLHYRIAVYCFDEEGEAKLTTGQSVQLVPTVRQEITLSLVMDLLVKTDSYDRNAQWSEDSYTYYPVTQTLGSHQDHLELWYLSLGDSVSLEQLLQVYRDIGHVGDYLEAEYVHYYWQEEDGELETPYFNGARSVTTGTQYPEPQIYRETYGTADTEEEACVQIQDVLNGLGIYGFSVSPYSWEGRWEDTFAPAFSGRYPTITLTMESTESQGEEGVTAGTTTFTIENYTGLS